MKYSFKMNDIFNFQSNFTQAKSKGIMNYGVYFLRNYN